MTMRTRRSDLGPLALLLLLLLVSAASVRSATVHIYVSPNGSDSNDGHSPSHPVLTLAHATTMFGNGNTVFVELMAGYHELHATLHVNHHNGPVVFRAYQGQNVHVVGGGRLWHSQFHKVTDTYVLQRLPGNARDKVLECDLHAAGVSDLGTLQPYGFALNSGAPLEVSINGEILRLAEWPNRNFINIQSTPAGRQGDTLTYDAAGHDALWAQETEPWVYGWWYMSWADRALKVAHIDTLSHTITLNGTTFEGIRVGHYDSTVTNNHDKGWGDQGGYFRVFNMLCEIDQPGEYYIDRQHKKLYLWPNTQSQTIGTSDVVYTSMVDTCITVSRGSRHISFEDFTLESCRGAGIVIQGAQNIVVKNLEIKNTGGMGVACWGDSCKQITVQANDIHDTCKGVAMSGGDTRNLTSSENVIRDNHIWHHSRRGAFSNHGIALSGVHTTVSHNEIDHGDYAGLWWNGNDHVIEYNNIHHECLTGSDCGAMHTGRHWEYRGNIIRQNHIHDNRKFAPGQPVRGIMLDDQYSSVLIDSNVFYNNDNHVNIGGGRDNVVKNNIMYNARDNSISADGRGLTKNGFGPELQAALDKSPYRNDIWKQRYPKLYDILNNNPNAPEGNQIYNNIFYNHPGVDNVQYADNMHKSEYFNYYSNLQSDHTSDYTSTNNADFRLHGTALQWANSRHFPTPVTPSQVGPTVPVGPHYKRA